MNKFFTSREIPASAEQIFDAFSNSERLARWWGPAGFTNTFNICEFKSGGTWSFVMHGPKAGHYVNESIFEEIDAPRRIVIRHLSEPKYRLTITLSPAESGTMLTWEQVFDKADVAERVSHIVIPANEENLDRLTAEVLGLKE